MTKKTTPQPAHELFVEVDKILARIAKQAEEDRKRAAEERAEDRKRAAEERAEERKRIAEERAKERAEDRERERERDEKAAKVREEYEQRLARTEALVDKNAKYIGTHANNEGELLEGACKVALKKMGNIGGVTLEDIQGMQSAKHGVEVDIIGINGKVVFPVEVKRTLSPEDVRHFADVRVERFKKAYEPAKGKEVRPVIIFGLSRPGKDADGKKEDPVQVALELGLIVMQTIGENQLNPITDPSQVVRRQHKED